MDIAQLTILTIGLAVVLLLGPLLIMHVLDQEQKRTEAWRKLAARHHLQFTPGRRVVQKTTVSGFLRGREFSLEQVAGKKNQAAVHMELVLRTKAADPDEVPAYLTEQRTKAALQLAEIGGSLEDHKLSVPVTQTMRDLEELDRTLRTLRRLAPVLETA